jgi:hypothetical protein
MNTFFSRTMSMVALAVACGAAVAVTPEKPGAKSGVEKASDAVQETGAKTQEGVKKGLKRANKGAKRGVDAASRGVNKAKKKMRLPDGPAPAPKEP